MDMTEIITASIAAIAVIISQMIATWRVRRKVRADVHDEVENGGNDLLEAIHGIAASLHHHVQWEEQEKYSEIHAELVQLRQLIQKGNP